MLSFLSRLMMWTRATRGCGANHNFEQTLFLTICQVSRRSLILILTDLQVVRSYFLPSEKLDFRIPHVYLCLYRLAISCRTRSNSSVAAMSSRNMSPQDVGSNASKDSIMRLSFLSKLLVIFCLFSTVYGKASWVTTRFLFSVNSPIDCGSSCLDPGGVLSYKGLMGTCGQPGYVFRDFCLKQGIEFIIFCLNRGIDLSIFVLNGMSFLGR